MDNIHHIQDLKNVAFVIQARMTSKRFPGKVLAEFCGVPMLYYQISLLKKNRMGLDIIVATSKNKENDKIEELCFKYNIKCVRGDEDNVIKRFYITAKIFSLDHIIRLTGDNPLPNLDLIRVCLNSHIKKLPDLTSTRRIFKDSSIKRYVPKGLSIDVLNCESLLNIDFSSLNKFEKEHVIPVFFREEYTVNIINDYKTNLQELSVGTMEDYKRISSYAENLFNTGQLL